MLPSAKAPTASPKSQVSGDADEQGLVFDAHPESLLMNEVDE